MLKPTIGQIVHYVQRKPLMYQPKDGPVALVHLPAIITAVWGGDTCVNLQVFTDGTNSDEMNMAPFKWITSCSLDETATQERSWHWPENE